MSELKRVARTLLREVTHFSPVPQKGRFILVFAQERTGSTLFMDLLNSHPDVLADQHIFYTPFTFPKEWHNGRTVFSRKPTRAFKAKVTHTPRKTPVEEVRERLAKLSERVSIVHLRRQDKLKQAFSVGVCDSTGVQQRLNGKEIVQKPRINVGKFMDALNYYTVLSKFEDKALEGVNHLGVVYERDLISSDRHQVAADKVFDYVGLESYPVGTRISKTSSKLLSEYVSNYDEVIEALQTSPHAHHLEYGG